MSALHPLPPRARRAGTGLAAAFAAALAALAVAPPAAAQSTQACYFPTEKPPANVYARPSDKAKLVGVLKPGDTFKRMLNVPERGDWSYLRWQVTENGKARLKKGWALGSQVYGGECED